MEENKPASIIDVLHNDFRANGEMDARHLKQLLMMYHMQHRTILITIVSAKTVIDPIYKDRAESTLSVLATGFSGSILPNDGNLRVVRLEWRKDGDWKILKANWQE